ncbi:MAG: MCE family protein [Ignavibacteriaceae bacterium]|nr:MCE family protein [Ignavibacteriaceae bacterium]
MKDTSRTEVKVGLTVIVGLILFIWILTWAKGFSISGNKKSILVSFKNVSGLEIGDEVSVNGVKKGEVGDFTISGENVIVELILDDNVQLQEDATFRIAMLDLMGGKKVEVYPGISNAPINYSLTHLGTYTADIASVMAMVGSVQDDLVSSIKDMKITLNTLNNYLIDKKLNDDIKNSISNLSNASKKLNLIIDENKESLNKLIKNSSELTEEAKNLLEKNKDDLSYSFSQMKKLIDETNTLMSRVNLFTEETKNKQNNIGKLIYDEELYKNLSKSITQLNELTQLILEQIKGDGFKVDADVDLF